MSAKRGDEWLFEGEGDGGGEREGQLRINTKYAARYEKKMRDERIQKLEAEVEALEASLESEDEVEDEVGSRVTGKLSVKFLEAFEKIRTKDPSIYKGDIELFEDDEDDEKDEEEKEKEKDKKNDSREAREKDDEQLPYAQQLEKARAEFKQAAKDVSDEEDGEDDDEPFLVEKKRTPEEEREYEEEFKKFLAEKKSRKLKEAGEQLSFWTAENLDDRDKFLRDYILGNMWIDEAMATKPVTQEELEQLSESSAELERADEFEAKYNFRFEEPGALNVFAPVAKNQPTFRSVKKTSRQKARDRKREEKEKERNRLAEELKRLKAEKRKEMAGGDNALAEMNDEELDAYLGLNYEGIAGGVKSRFKYEKVKPHTFGLDAVDLLNIREDVLEDYVPQHALAPYRKDEWKPNKTKRVRINAEKKRVREKLGIRDEPPKAVQGKKEGANAEAAAAAGEGEKKKKKKKKKDKKNKKKKNKTVDNVEGQGQQQQEQQQQEQVANK